MSADVRCNECNIMVPVRGQTVGFVMCPVCQGALPVGAAAGGEAQEAERRVGRHSEAGTSGISLRAVSAYSTYRAALLLCAVVAVAGFFLPCWDLSFGKLSGLDSARGFIEAVKAKNQFALAFGRDFPVGILLIPLIGPLSAVGLLWRVGTGRFANWSWLSLFWIAGQVVFVAWVIHKAGTNFIGVGLWLMLVAEWVHPILYLLLKRDLAATRIP